MDIIYQIPVMLNSMTIWRMLTKYIASFSLVPENHTISTRSHRIVCLFGSCSRPLEHPPTGEQGTPTLLAVWRAVRLGSFLQNQFIRQHFCSQRGSPAWIWWWTFFRQPPGNPLARTLACDLPYQLPCWLSGGASWKDCAWWLCLINKIEK